MSLRFFSIFTAAFLVTAGILGGAGYAVSRWSVAPPRDVFRTGYFEFELSPGWWCELDGTEYVCTPPGKAPHSAIAIIALKERNNEDTLDAYEDHLRKQQATLAATPEFRMLGTVKIGQPTAASPVVESAADINYVRRRKLGDHTWIEALQLGSEIANFETYYLGTTTSGLGILVTLSVHKNQAAKYIGELDVMIASLQIYQR